ncbi:MAG: hypothetical protein JWL83_3531 [Actinomycetia bacterium]|nr:hypothetical protein [Actinomycetes bacterium]
MTDRVVTDGGAKPPATEEAAPARSLAFSVAIRLLAVALLAWFVPVAGLVALAALVVVWLFRSRLDVTTVLVLYAMALWFIPSRYTVGAFAVTGAMAFGFVAIVLWAYGRSLPTSRVAHGPSPTNRAVLVFLLVTLVNYAIVVLRPLSDLDQRSADRNLAIILVLCGLAAAITDGVRSARRLDRMLGVLVFGCAVVAMIGFVQYFFHIDVPRYLHPPGFHSTGEEAFTYHRTAFTRVAGTALHPIEFGVALAAMLPLALHYGSYARTSLSRNGARIAALLIVGAIPLTLSRSAVLATGLVALVLLPTWAAGRRWRVFLTVIVALVVLNLLAPGVFRVIGQLFTGEKGAGSLATRSDATTIGFNLIGRNPIFGNGFAVSSGSPVIIDNQYLVTGVETGLVGVVALFTVIGSGIVTARRARRGTADPAARDLAQSLVAMIGALALGGFGLNILRFPITAGLLFIGVGSAGALLRIGRRTAIVEPPVELIGAEL